MSLPNVSLFDVMLTPERRRMKTKIKPKINGKKRAEGCEFAKEPNVFLSLIHI